VDVRRCEAFLASNWWTFLNLQAILDDQARLFGDPRHPGLYVVQEYEPLFYPMSSTHLFARDALSDQRRSWHLINSSEMQAFLGQMGHRSERSWLFEPALSEGLRPAFSLPPVDKVRRILVYGRPTIPRNCFSAVVEGVRRWAARHPEHGQWQVMSAGLPHPPIPLDGTRTITPVGKLDLSAYGALLRETAVGVSLMASAHPSYPPLEMAHFGLLTLTNSFHPKTLETSHENLRSVRSIAADHIADALARACADFEADPGRGWRGASLRPSFLVRDPLEQLASLVPALRDEFWPEAG
jgi:hypothetical protein